MHAQTNVIGKKGDPMPVHGDNEDPTRERYRLSPLPKRYVKVVRALFPHMRNVIDRVLEESEPFRSLVKEYGACTEVLERQRVRTQPQARAYAALRLRLESEILQSLSDYIDSQNS
jgi:hypothetical protein